MAYIAGLEKAYAAMAKLHINEETLEPILRKLLLKYNNNWEKIEEGNYKAIIDEIHGTEHQQAQTREYEDEDDTPTAVEKCGSSGAGPSNSWSAQTLDDITNGYENRRISLVNETGSTVELPNFFYISECSHYKSAHIDRCLARIADEECCSECSGDCLSNEVTCVCARENGGVYAYTKEGLLREDFLHKCISMHEEPEKHYKHFCKDCPLEKAKAKEGSNPEQCNGHLLRDFIKECGLKCGCNVKQCKNRIVQQGITRNLQVFWTNEDKGWGIRTPEELPKGAFLFEYVGEILTNMELHVRNAQTSNHRHTYPVQLDADWGSEAGLNDENALCLDATYLGNVARFINHRCVDCNVIDIPVQVDCPDRHYYRLAFFTKRKLNAMEELTWDYGIDFEDSDHPIKAFKCTCGSPFCRDESTTKGKAKAKAKAKAKGAKRRKTAD